MARKMVQSVKNIFGSFVVGAAALMLPSTVSADEITLTFEDHGFTMSGDFKTVTNDSYVIVTDHGEVTVPIELVSCDGADCIDPVTVLAGG